MLISEKNVRHWAVIPAAGAGNRMESHIPKQYLPLTNATVIEHGLKQLIKSEVINAVVVALASDDQRFSTLPISKDEKLITCIGGSERCNSVFNCLQKLAELGAKENDWVLVHDAARPCLSQHDLESLIKSLANHPIGGLLAMPVRDTLKRATDQTVDNTVVRENLWQAQTPQMFRFKLLKQALQDAIEKNIAVTDEAMAVELQGHQPMLVPASQTNIKITYPEDLIMAKQLLASENTVRIGQGYDVHQFEAGRPLILGGVKVPYEMGLKGHSDADVVLHALSDALLGAAALGDIGQHFPDTSDENAGRDSREFLADIYQKITEKGYRLINADVTIIAEAPKMAPHIQAMREGIADICSVQLNQINVKATTSEGLGFVGRKEGIACQAVVTLAAN